ncbi:otoancorin isoform X2 [Hyla sarda]|uniref:otoancorin isoform X2 n=1 Tax=Hyla sarda TaxID=327740 RepID=UPI0024C3DC4F|nr:otoancorin isoform X2 [Hyla sarda]
MYKELDLARFLRMLTGIFFCFLMVIYSQKRIVAAQSSPFSDLPEQVIRGLNELISGKYLNGLLEIMQFQSLNKWTPDLEDQILRYLSTPNPSYIFSLQISIRRYLADLSDDPELVLSELEHLDPHLFARAMEYLFSGRKENFGIAGIDVDFETMRNEIFQSPVGNRSLFNTTIQKCLPVLYSAVCVKILGQVIHLYGGTYLQSDVIARLPTEIPDDPFRNLSSVFRGLYDKLKANDRRALYEWMTQVLQKSYAGNDVNASISWVTAESLWILGRFMVHLPLDEIKKISIIEIRIFISYDNATKQLDTVYDITQDLAKAFLELMNSSGFDMRNISTLYRLGLLICFYDDIQDLEPVMAKALLHQMIKCNQLRGFRADVQKLKSQFLQIAVLNQTLNESLGSLSDAVVGLTISQLESLSPEAVQSAILTLQQVSGWTKSQIIVLTRKFLHSEKVLTYSNISQLGELVSGVSADYFYDMNSRDLLIALKSGLAQHLPYFTPTQQESILSKLMSSGEFHTVLSDINGAFFKQVSLSQLLAQRDLDVTELHDKEMRRSQALLLFDLLLPKVPLVNLLSTGQLVKGLTCEYIDNMSKPTFLNHYKLIEKNLPLLSPHQIHCLAWKYWKVSQATIPPFLLAVLPTEYSASPLPCRQWLMGLRKMDVNYLLVHASKKDFVINKVNQCLNNSVADVYQLDILGDLICHLSPSIIETGISSNVIEAALSQLKTCLNLSQEQSKAIKYRIQEHYGNPLNWTSETVQDMAPFWNLLSKEEIMIITGKFQKLVSEIVSAAAGIAQSEEMLSGLFHSIHLPGANISEPDQTADCIGIRAPSAGTVMVLGEANAFWTSEELQCMTVDTFAKCVHILGVLRSLNQSQLFVLKEKAKLVWGPLSEWRSYHMTVLGRIATALSVRELHELHLHSTDMVSALTQQTEWTPLQAKSILNGFLNDSGKSMKDLKSFELAGLGCSVCAADAEQIEQMNTLEFSSIISRIGSFPCSPRILQAFKNRTEKIYGKTEKWSHFVLNDVGYITAGFTKEDFRTLDPRLMPYIQPSAIKLIPGEIFKDLSPEQILNLGSENGAMVTESQRAQLNSVQMHSLREALEGRRAGTNTSVPVTIRTTTTATTLLISKSVIITTDYCVVFAFVCHLLYT